MKLSPALYAVALLAARAAGQTFNDQLLQWPFADVPGSPLSAQQPNAELTAALEQISVANINATIAKLVSFGTRHTLSSQTDPNRGIGAARKWIQAQMQTFVAASNGRMNVTAPCFTQQPASGIPTATTICNVLATLPGTTDPGRTYVVSGHYDSRVSNLSNSVDDAPGADDDGSGVAVSMELARVFANVSFPATLIFAAVAGEEQGLYGATNLAQTLKAAGADVQGMFTNDIVGSPVGDDGFSDPNSIRLFAQGMPTTESASTTATREAIGGENDAPARELGRFTAEVASNEVTNMSVRMIYRADRFLRGGDHEPFLQEGFPAARFTEPNENFAHQHQDVRVVNGVQFGDLIEFCDMEFISRVARVNGAAMYSLGKAPGTPKSVVLDTSVLTNNSTLTWAVANDSGLAGFEILWRPTAEPLWTHVIPVGKVGTATVHLSKDNVIMGVRAVGTNGLRSPAGFPFPSAGD